MCHNPLSFIFLRFPFFLTLFDGGGASVRSIFFFFTVSHLLLLERRSQSVRKMQKRIQNGFASIGRQLDSTDSQKGYFSYIKI